MSVVSYQCPNTENEVVTAIESDDLTLKRMQASKLSLWVWCPHCMAGHQLKPAEATLQDELRTVKSPAMAAS